MKQSKKTEALIEVANLASRTVDKQDYYNHLPFFDEHGNVTDPDAYERWIERGQ